MKRIFRPKTKKGKAILAIALIIVVSLLIPQTIINPVEGCGTESYSHDTFWQPWGDHHHHGVDIFAKKGTPIHSPITPGLVIATTHNRGAGGNTVSILGSHGRIYYMAHLDEVKTHIGAVVTRSTVIGTVGNTGNAATTPPHCHFSIMTIFPRISHWVPVSQYTMRDDAFKMFFVNPVKALNGEQIW
ncbi:MAG: M23 family metallopeptidase [Bacteroidales bacterium]|nr:M23 family metallopeptidase [Bacteroidales bacterium]